MTQVAYCPTCGTRRQAGAQFCVSCGYRFEGVTQLIRTPAQPSAQVDPPAPTAQPPTPPAAVAAAPTDRTTTLSLVAGIGWILAALALGYLAFLQLQFAPLAGAQESNLRGLAIWNGIAAAITLVIGSRLILGGSASDLLGSTIWAALNVVYGGWQISQGVTHEAFIVATLLSGAAGIVSFVAWRQAPKQERKGPSRDA